MTFDPQPPSRSRLARHTLWNLVGMCAPMAVALFAIPLLIEGLGKERFGLLSLVWMLVGYFSVFDLGLGRALTKLIAEKIDRQPHEVAATFWTAMTLMLGLGILGGVLVYSIAPWLAHSALNIDPALQPETLRSFRAVAWGLPVLITVTGLVGTLEACHRFPLVNIIRVPTGAFTFIGPLLVLPFSRDLYAVVLVLLAGRIVEWLLFFTACLRTVPGLRDAWRFNRAEAPHLLGFGGWMTISNIVQPLMIHIDRFLIGALRSVAEVAFYVTPAEIVVKLLILPRAWVSVLFPTFAAEFKDRPESTSALFAQSVRLLLVLLFPVVLLLIAFAPEGLTLWLGAEFGERSAPVMRWLTAGVFLYSLAFVPTSLLQGTGRPDLTAKLHAVELPLYLAAAALLITRFGIVGAAAAWVLRAAIDIAGTAWMAARRAPGSGASLLRVGKATAVALALLAAIAWQDGLLTRIAASAVVLAGYLLGCWRWLFSDEDRRIVRKRIPGLRAS
ncbi:MAG TPA: flippase [Kiritimatiellia bacterium]|nr:flippase [Kiritimatiellia bacterium]